MASTKLFTKDDIPGGSLFINNEWTPSSSPQRITVINPATEAEITSNIHIADENDVNTAVACAKSAFEGEWSKYTGAQRSARLNKFADLMDAHAADLAWLESMASGRPLSMILSEIAMATACFRYYAGWADKLEGESFPAENGFLRIVQHEPLGVCAGITAWNASLIFVSWKCAPALAAGNTVILKPSEKSPLGTLACGHLILAAGFPPGVFQILTGAGETGKLLSSHMDIQKISFTGSIQTGRRVQAAATASNMKRVTLELGGKGPALVFEDANMEKAVHWCTLGITINSGQVCAATSRIYVHASIAEKFTALLKTEFEKITAALGANPQEPTTSFGPMVDKQQHQNVMSFIDSGKSTAKLLHGGEPYTGKGLYIPPTIFLDPEDNADIYKKEIFGPVLCIKTFKTEEEALALANNTVYGLSGSVYTESISRSLRLSSKIQAGSVWVNCAAILSPQTPMGGFKTSGYGREMGKYALRHYTEPKTIFININ